MKALTSCPKYTYSFSHERPFPRRPPRRRVWGALVGDALGVPVEFMSRETVRKNPVSDMRGYGTHNQPAGDVVGRLVAAPLHRREPGGVRQIRPGRFGQTLRAVGARRLLDAARRGLRYRHRHLPRHLAPRRPDAARRKPAAPMCRATATARSCASCPSRSGFAPRPRRRAGDPRATRFRRSRTGTRARRWRAPSTACSCASSSPAPRRRTRCAPRCKPSAAFSISRPFSRSGGIFRCSNAATSRKRRSAIWPRAAM